MRILYVGMDNTQYGAPSHECRVARVLAELGHEVTLVTERVPEWESPPPKALRQLVAPLNMYGGDQGLREKIAYAWPDVDVAFASSVSGAQYLAAWKKRTGKPVVAQVLDVPLFRLFLGAQVPWFEQWRAWFTGLMAMDRLVVNTEQTWDDLATAAKLYEAQGTVPTTSVVYYGVDTDAARGAQPAERMNERFTFGSVGRLVPYRGVDLAMFALSLFDPKGRPNLAVIGAGEDLERLALLAVTAGLANDVALAGGVSDVDKWGIIKACDAGVSLQFNPNIPQQAPLEFVYCGKPCIVPDLSIVRERCGDHGVIYVDPFNTQSVADAMSDVMEDAKDDKSAWPDEADRKWVEENRSFRSHAAGVVKVLEALA